MGSESGPRNEWPHADFNVLVTGFQPWQKGQALNPSWEIASRLPSHLPVPGAHDAYNRPVANLPRVRIFTYPAPMRVSYRTVRHIIPKLWAGTATLDDANARLPSASSLASVAELGKPPQAMIELQKSTVGGDNRASDENEHNENEIHNMGSATDWRPGVGTRIDLMVHMGQADPRHVYRLEAQAHRDGYTRGDVDNYVPDDDVPRRDTGRAPCEDPAWPWRDCPVVLHTVYAPAMEAIWNRWCSLVPFGTPIAVSRDAGRFLCDFTYYSSLALLHRAGEVKRAVFVHVSSDPEYVEEGVGVVVALIQALVECRLGYVGEAL